MDKDKYDNFDDTIYQDEPIVRRKECDTPTLPPLFRKMRLLEKASIIGYSSYRKIFYLQGKMMADYTDEYNYNKEVIHYYPTYQSLTNDELRGYFTWRTYVKDGFINKTWLTYVFLYTYELINQIGVTDPLDGYHKLSTFMEKYILLDPYISRFWQRWERAYIIYYNLDVSLLKNNIVIQYDKNIMILLDKDESKDNDILNALDFLSSYKILKSPLYKKNEQDVSYLIPRIFKRICFYYDTHHKHTLINDLFGHYTNRFISMFEDAIFCDRLPNRNYEYIFDSIRYYKCVDGCYYATGFTTTYFPNKKLGSLLKTIDSIIREKINFPRQLKKEISYKWLTKIINEEITEYLNKKKQTKVIEIDYSILSKIRDDSLITRDKLIIDEEKIDDSFVSNYDNEDNSIPRTSDIPDDYNNNSTLNLNEYHLMQCLLYNESYNWVSEKGIMLSVMIDNINEKLYDIFNDTVLVYNSDTNIEIIEDYIDDLKGVIKK